MSNEKNITRDVEFHETLDHRWFFILKESGKEIHISGPYNARENCFIEGIELLNFLHETKPLLNKD